MAKQYGSGSKRCSGGNSYTVKASKMSTGGGSNVFTNKAPSMKGAKKGFHSGARRSRGMTTAY
jgi:hypothetical protein